MYLNQFNVVMSCHILIFIQCDIKLMKIKIKNHFQMSQYDINFALTIIDVTIQQINNTTM